MNAPLGLARYVISPSPSLTAREDVPLLGERSSSTSPPHGPSAEGWTELHERLVALGRRRAQHEHEICHGLLAAERLGVAAACGFAGLYEYADRYLGLTRRQTEERLRVGRALVELPELDRALREGRIVWSKARELTRIATRDTERQWLDHAEGRTCEQVAKDIATHQTGDRPTDPADPNLERRRVTFEVEPETLALIREAKTQLAGDLGAHAPDGARLDDDTFLNELIRRALAAPSSARDDSRASYQIAVTRCDGCRITAIDAGGEQHHVDEAITAMAECDAQELGRVDERPQLGAKRASQAVPPATRRAVLRRDGRRCAVPGCRNHRFLDVHHIVPRSEGGGHDPENLTVLCGAHHRATHRGRLVLEGTAMGLRIAHADGSPYGAPRLDPHQVDVAAQAHRGLMNLGFKQTQARHLVRTVQQQGAPCDLAAFLQAALRLA